MKSFYSILQVPTKPAGQEVLNVGLLMADGNHLHFAYSLKKFDKLLIPEAACLLFKSYLVCLELGVSNERRSIQQHFRKKKFIKFLANYRSARVIFTRPEAVNLQASDNNFKMLFEKLICTNHE
jgi:hypothetical protein